MLKVELSFTSLSLFLILRHFQVVRRLAKSANSADPADEVVEEVDVGDDADQEKSKAAEEAEHGGALQDEAIEEEKKQVLRAQLLQVLGAVLLVVRIELHLGAAHEILHEGGAVLLLGAVHQGDTVLQATAELREDAAVLQTGKERGKLNVCV